MGKLGYGYGSEFHLLRWLGRHRTELSKRAEAVLGLKDLEWLDFGFDGGNPIPDAELKGLCFLKDNPAYEKVLEAYRVGEISWPQKGQQMNWDAIGVANGTYVLCEAKAHIEEIEKVYSPGESESVRQRIRAFDFAKRKVGAKADADWMHGFYQMANRLYVLALLSEFGIKAKLLNIYFCGDKFPDAKYVCPVDASGWQGIIDEEYAFLGIDRTLPYIRDNVCELFLPVVA